MNKTSTIILGIDPGTLIMGYGIIKISGAKIHLIQMDVLRLSSKKDPYKRLQLIYNKISELIHIYEPDCFAIEAPFYGKNVQSMLKLGRSQGVAIAAAMQAGLEVTEYSPKKIKQSITGNGNADKEQVYKMLQRLMPINETPEFYDASDALAVAVCHHFQQKNIFDSSSKKLSGWGDFIAQNPSRVAKKK